jgi:hypothetical protein
MSWLIKFLLSLGSLVMSFFPGQQPANVANASQAVPVQIAASAPAQAKAAPAQCTREKQTIPAPAAWPKTGVDLVAYTSMKRGQINGSAASLALKRGNAAQHKAEMIVARLNSCTDVSKCDWQHFPVIKSPVRVRVEVPPVDVAQLQMTAENARQLARTVELRKLERASFPIESQP